MPSTVPPQKRGSYSFFEVVYRCPRYSGHYLSLCCMYFRVGLNSVIFKAGFHTINRFLKLETASFSTYYTSRLRFVGSNTQFKGRVEHRLKPVTYHTVKGNKLDTPSLDCFSRGLIPQFKWRVAAIKNNTQRRTSSHACHRPHNKRQQARHTSFE